MKQFLVILSALAVSHAHSQISPPGLGKAKTADWFAFGVRQELDTIKDKGWYSMTYMGIGRKSNPDNDNPFYKPAIVVLNQEFYNQFHQNWSYSLALSYRKQDEHKDEPPYGYSDPEFRQEFRFYSRLSYLFSTGSIKFVPTLRQEFRKFYSPSFQTVDENFQLRTRLRLQLTVNLDKQKTKKLLASSEQIFSISKENAPDKWSDFNYRESRFSLYYSWTAQKSPFILSVGYMNNLLGTKNPYSVHYLAFDIVAINLFKIGKHPRKSH